MEWAKLGLQYLHCLRWMMLLLLCINQKYFEILFSLVSLFLTLYFGFTWEPPRSVSEQQSEGQQSASDHDQSTRTSAANVTSPFHLNSNTTTTSSSFTCSCDEHYLHYQQLQYLNQSAFCPLNWPLTQTERLQTFMSCHFLPSSIPFSLFHSGFFARPRGKQTIWLLISLPLLAVLAFDQKVIRLCKGEHQFASALFHLTL